MSITTEDRVEAVAINGKLRQGDCSYHTWIVKISSGQFQALNAPDNLVYNEDELADLAKSKHITQLNSPKWIKADTIAWHIGDQWRQDLSTLGSIELDLPKIKTEIGELFEITVQEANQRRESITKSLLQNLDQAASNRLHLRARAELIPATRALLTLCSTHNQELEWELGPRLSALYLLASKPEQAHNVWRYRFKKHINEQEYEERVRRVQKMWSFQRHTPVEVEPLTSEHIFDLSQFALNQYPTPTSLDQPFLNITGSIVQKQRDIQKWAAAALLKTQHGEKP